MKPLHIPNIPTGVVTAAIVDGRVFHKFEAAFKKLKITMIPTLAHPDVYQAVAYHPDIMLHHIGDDIVVYAPNTPVQLLNSLRDRGFTLVKGHKELGGKYPETIAYNVARLGRFAIHNTKHTDPVLKELLISRGVEFLHTSQGYSKCLTCIVEANSIITSDSDIHKKVLSSGLDSLLIEPDAAIRLEPFKMGFIGGATGLIDEKRLAVAGNLKFHKNYKQIIDFLSLKSVSVVMLNDEKLIDIGSIIPIEQNQ